jgi:uncharacterized protein
MKKLLLLLIFLPVFVFTQIPSPLRNTYVHDYAHVLTADQVQELNRTIFNIDTANKIKFAIILINELPGNYSIEDYARDIGNKWHVGKGIIYVAAINQHKQRLEVSAHLEGIIPDIKAKHITDNIKPYFKNKNYYSGLIGMVNSINVLIKDDVLPDQKVVEKKATFPLWMALVLFIFGGSGIILFFYYKSKRDRKKFKDQIAAAKEKIDAIAAEETKNKKLSSTTIRPYIRSKKDYDDDYTPPTIIYTPPSSNEDYNSRSSSNDDYNSGSSNNDYNSSDGNSDSYSGGGSSNDW